MQQGAGSWFIGRQHERGEKCTRSWPVGRERVAWMCGLDVVIIRRGLGSAGTFTEVREVPLLIATFTDEGLETGNSQGTDPKLHSKKMVKLGFEHQQSLSRHFNC